MKLFHLVVVAVQCKCHDINTNVLITEVINSFESVGISAFLSNRENGYSFSFFKSQFLTFKILSAVKVICFKRQLLSRCP